MATVQLPLRSKVLHTVAILRRVLRKDLLKDLRRTGITRQARGQTKVMATRRRMVLSPS